MAFISRNPFAREELHREIVRPSPASLRPFECAWCGQTRRNGTLFQYGIERDGVSPSYTARRNSTGLFCSLSCHNSYHS